jgi:hypothetical protein
MKKGEPSRLVSGTSCWLPAPGDADRLETVLISVAAGPHREDSRWGVCRRHIDARDPRVRMRRAEHIA